MTRHIRAALSTLWVTGTLLLAACSAAAVQPAAPPTVAPAKEAKAEAEAEADWTQTVTVEGDFYVLGNPAAPVRLVDFSDFF